jgi:hypothetical protein
MATGGWIGGVLYGFFGSYDVTIVLSVVASVSGALVLLSMEPTSRLLIPNWEDSLPHDARSTVAGGAAAGD